MVKFAYMQSKAPLKMNAIKCSEATKHDASKPKAFVLQQCTGNTKAFCGHSNNEHINRKRRGSLNTQEKLVSILANVHVCLFIASAFDISEIFAICTRLMLLNRCHQTKAGQKKSGFNCMAIDFDCRSCT